MKSETFTADTLEKADAMKKQWLSSHKVTLKKETPLVMRKPAGRFKPRREGKVLSASITIEYED